LIRPGETAAPAQAIVVAVAKPASPEQSQPTQTIRSASYITVPSR
jgi:hypothetical protein